MPNPVPLTVGIVNTRSTRSRKVDCHHSDAIGDAVTRLLDHSGWTIRAFAELIGISPTSAMNLSRGRCTATSPNVAKLMRALGLPDVPGLAQSADGSFTINLTTGPNYPLLRTSTAPTRIARTAAPLAPIPVRLLKLSGDVNQWREAGLPRDVTHISLPSETDLPGLPEAHDAFPNPDDGGGIARGRIVFTNRDQIPLGFDPGSCIRGDRLVVDFPDRVYRVRVYLGDTRVFDINGRNVIDTNQPGYRIVGKVIAHAPYHGIIRESGYPSDGLPE